MNKQSLLELANRIIEANEAPISISVEAAKELKKALTSRPSLPDALTYEWDSPDYVDGWNECREVIAGMQAESEADKVIIEYHEATIKRLEAELKARGNT